MFSCNSKLLLRNDFTQRKQALLFSLLLILIVFAEVKADVEDFLTLSYLTTKAAEGFG